MLSSPTSLFFTTSLVVAASIADANNSTIVPANFKELLAVPQGVTALRLRADCSSWMRTRVPNTMYTIQPNEDDSQSVRVWTYPANLVTAKVDDVDTLEFEWNEEVASEAQEGGVFVTFPAAQFNRLAVSSGTQAQVLDGFTNIQTLRVSSGAYLDVTMTQNSDALSSLEASSSGRITVVSNVPVKDVSVSASSSGAVLLQAPGTLEYVKASSGGTILWQGPGLVTTARVSSGGYIKLEGSLQDARLSSGSVLQVHNGNFTGHAEASSGSALEIAGGSVASTASFELRSGSTVRAPQCINVVTRSGGQCRVVDNSTPEHENIQVLLQPFTSTGSGSCGGGYYHMNIPSIVGSFVGAAIIIGAIVVGLYVRRRRCSRRKTDHHHHHSTAEPTTASTFPEATTLPQATVMGYENKPVMAEVVHSHINDVDKNTPPEKIPIV